MHPEWPWGLTVTPPGCLPHDGDGFGRREVGRGGSSTHPWIKQVVYTLCFIYWPEFSLSLKSIWKPSNKAILFQMRKLRIRGRKGLALLLSRLGHASRTPVHGFSLRPSAVPIQSSLSSWSHLKHTSTDHWFEYLTFPYQKALFLRTKPFSKLFLQI